jgi:hypothetical protein
VPELLRNLPDDQQMLLPSNPGSTFAVLASLPPHLSTAPACFGTHIAAETPVMLDRCAYSSSSSSKSSSMPHRQQHRYVTGLTLKL